MAVNPRPGAEAVLEFLPFNGIPAMRKTRVHKGYRRPELDEKLRQERTRDEASRLIAAKKAGIRTPVVFDVDRHQATIWMEAIQGITLRDQLLDDDEETAHGRLLTLGQLVGKLHQAGLTHGDLTTSNVMVQDGSGDLVLLDFGLGKSTQESEPRGVDLHLVEEALQASDERYEPLFAAFLAGYKQTAGKKLQKALESLDDIRLRGRYR